MAFHLHRLRRALPLSCSLLEHCFHGCKPKPVSSISASRLLPTPAATTQLMRRPFTSTTTLFRRAFNPETDEVGPDTILFEGCDYKHWLITVDFPKDSNMTREQMIETYVNIAAQVFGSVEEAKKRVYALSTTTYVGFQVECSEETSEKFKSIPAVVFVLPDSYIDPVNKEYGGDKYVNGEIFPRPPPVHYGRRSNRDRRPSLQQNYGPPSSPQQQNYGPPSSQQSYQAPPSQQSYQAPPSQQSYGPPPSQQNYGPPPSQQSYRPPPSRESYGPPPSRENYGPPPSRENYGPPPSRENYGPPPSQQNYGLPPSQQNYGPPPSQQNYGPPPSQQNYGPPLSQQNYGSPPSQQNYGPPPLQNYGPPQQGYTPQPHQSYGPPPQQSYVPNTQGLYGNAPNFPPHPNNSPAGPGVRSGYMPPNNTSRHDERNPASSYQGNINRADLETHSALGQGKLQSHTQPGQRGFSQDANYGSSQDQAFGQVSGGQKNFSSSENY